jgi:hypothetical protein
MCVQIQHEILSIYLSGLSQAHQSGAPLNIHKTIAPVLAEYEVLKLKKVKTILLFFLPHYELVNTRINPKLSDALHNTCQREQRQLLFY